MVGGGRHARRRASIFRLREVRLNEGEPRDGPRRRRGQDAEQRTRDARVLGLPRTRPCPPYGACGASCSRLKTSARPRRRVAAPLAEDVPRVGDPSRDASRPPRPTEQRRGRPGRPDRSARGTNGAARACDAHYAGERGEIHPCNYSSRTSRTGRRGRRRPSARHGASSTARCICASRVERLLRAACSPPGAFDDAAAPRLRPTTRRAACERKCDGGGGRARRQPRSARGALGCLCSADYMAAAANARSRSVPRPRGSTSGRARRRRPWPTSIAACACATRSRWTRSTNRGARSVQRQRTCSLPCPERVFGRGEWRARARRSRRTSRGLFAISSARDVRVRGGELAAEVASAARRGGGVRRRPRAENDVTGFDVRRPTTRALRCATAAPPPGTCDAAQAATARAPRGFGGSERQVSCGGRGSLAPRSSETMVNEVFDVKSLFRRAARAG